ncbi:pectinesterase inhibitor 9-like [Coffea eugenioides]|uniref:pectinesterase inhibitor 9-like n=1 Tax=Coffea eugenioides TaxID=49369 RepID=UPI000F613749|nr:pectinesterase inhibitor 9-like [Coffea eugenioides]
MANCGFYLLLFLSFHYFTPATSDPTVSASDFIKAACKTTRFYALCVTSLAPYSNTIQQSERQLVRAALTVALSKAQSTKLFVAKFSNSTGLKPRESQALKDCKDNMVDSFDQLSQSMQELARLNNQVTSRDFRWHMSNVQTWVSAALTDDSTCLDGFSGSYMSGKVKVPITRRVVYVAQVTSNALALINRFAATGHRSGPTSNAP